jgi:hypothetical protein
MNTQYIPSESDNLTVSETVLTVPTDEGVSVRVQIDPQEIFENMIENNVYDEDLQNQLICQVRNIMDMIENQEDY